MKVKHNSKKTTLKQLYRGSISSESGTQDMQGSDTLNDETDKKTKERKSIGGKIEKKKSGGLKMWSLLHVFGCGSKSAARKQTLTDVQPSKMINQYPNNSQKIKHGKVKYGKRKIHDEIAVQASSEIKLKVQLAETKSPDKRQPNHKKDTNMIIESTNSNLAYSMIQIKDIHNSSLLNLKDLRNLETMKKCNTRKNSTSSEDAVKVNCTKTYDNKAAENFSLPNCSEDEILDQKNETEKFKANCTKTPERKIRKVDSFKSQSNSAHKYSLRGAGSTPPRPTRIRNKAVRKLSIKELNSKIKDSCSSESSTAVVSHKPPIKKPPRRSYPTSKQNLLEQSETNEIFLNKSHLSLNICNKSDSSGSESNITSKEQPYFEATSIPLSHNLSSHTTKDQGKENHCQANSGNIHTPKQLCQLHRRSRSLSSGKLTLSETRLSNLWRRPVNNKDILQVDAACGFTPKSRKNPRKNITRSQSLRTSRNSSKVLAPEMTPFSAVALELKVEMTNKKSKKKELSLIEIIDRTREADKATDESQGIVKKKPTPQKPPRKNLKSKSNKETCDKPFMKTSIKKKPSFREHVEDGVARVRRRLSIKRNGDHDKCSIDATHGGNQSLNVLHAGQTPKPPKRSKNERVIL